MTVNATEELSAVVLTHAERDFVGAESALENLLRVMATQSPKPCFGHAYAALTEAKAALVRAFEAVSPEIVAAWELVGDPSDQEPPW